MINRFAMLSALGGVLLGATSAAQADLTVVNDVTISGLPAAAVDAANAPSALKSNTPITTTTYYKGDNVRIEAPGSVTITTAASTITLNPVAKTYFVSAAGVDPAAAAGGANAFLSMLKFDAKATVTPTTLAHKSILGHDAAAYDYTAKVNISVIGGDPSMAAMFPSVTINGQRWTTTTITDATASDKFTASMGRMATASPLMGGFAQVAKQLASIKGFPLTDQMTVNIVFPEGSPLAAQAGDQIPKKITVRNEVKSLSEAPLADSLFAAPADYKKVDPPAPKPGIGLPDGAPAPNGNL